MSFHDYEGVMLVLCTPLQVKCYPNILLCWKIKRSSLLMVMPISSTWKG